MGRTKQQQTVVNAALNPAIDLVKVQATAGSGKTFTLVELAKELKPTKGLYLAYNKAIADEASEKFKGTNVECATIHSLAWNHTVRQYGLKVGFFGLRDIQPQSMHYKNKVALLAALEDFFLSAYVDPIAFLEDSSLSSKLHDDFIEHLNLMTTGTIRCSHSFYLKLFHVYLASGDIVIPEIDLLLVDEAGDLTELTIEVFRILKAKKKIAVGDPMQNIYSFNKTVNAFDVLAGEGTSVPLTESFRVSDLISARIEQFVQKHLQRNFEFSGRSYPLSYPVTTRGYIARGNSGLLEEMFRLMVVGEPFHTTRKIDLIVELPMVLADLDSGKAITEYKYKHIEKLRVEWETSFALHKNYPTATKYIRECLKGEEETDKAFAVLSKHNGEELKRLVAYAKECAKHPCDLTLSTAHSSKGLEFSEVEIAQDLNVKVSKTLDSIRREEIADCDNSPVVIAALQEELRLYYVACSRAMVSLINAVHLPVLHDIID